MEIILQGLAERYETQEGFSLEDFIRTFEELLNELMLQEMGELLAK